MKKFWLVAIVCTLAPFAAQFYGDRAGGWLMVDFRAYYCASSALLHRENPYSVAALHPCESVPAAPYYRAPSSVTVPAPYPPYALAFVAPLAILPFAFAVVLWWLLLAGCVVVAAWALARLTGLPVLVPWACLVLSLGLTSLSAGNVMPVCVAALVLAALCASRGRFAAAAICLAIAAVEPHVALPAIVASFVYYRRQRAVLAVTFAILAGVSLIAGGVTNNLAYLTAVIPAHALSEVSRDNQYSLSTVVAALGAGDAQAVFAGSISYVVMTAVGVVAALRIARHDGAAWAVTLLPPALGLLGGSFVHTVEFSAAVPAALAFVVRSPNRSPISLPALVLLAVPWMLATSAAMFLAPLFPVAYLVYASSRNRTAALAAALGSLALVVLLFALAAHPATASAHRAPHPYIDPTLAESSWRAFVLSGSTNRLVMWLLRIPTWIGLILLAVETVRLAYAARPRESLGR